MQLDPDQSDVKTIYATMIRAITPRPIAWVSTISPRGISNLAPFSYFNGVGSQPPALMFSVVNHPDGARKDTVVNIEDTGQFVVNLVPYSLRESMQQTAAGLGYEVSEFGVAGLTETPSQRVAPPGVLESPVRFECDCRQIVSVGEGAHAANVIIGEVRLIQIADEVLDAAGKIDPEKLDTIGRMGGRSYCRTTERFVIDS